MTIFPSMSKQVTRVLFITLGTMWLSFAIAPCVSIHTLEKSQHNCCPQSDGNTGTSTHMHDQGLCDSCDMVQPVLKSSDNYILSSKAPASDFHPAVIEWNYDQTRQPVINTPKLPVTVYQTLPPSLRFRVLLI